MNDQPRLGFFQRAILRSSNLAARTAKNAFLPSQGDRLIEYDEGFRLSKRNLLWADSIIILISLGDFGSTITIKSFADVTINTGQLFLLLIAYLLYLWWGFVQSVWRVNRRHVAAVFSANPNRTAAQIRLDGATEEFGRKVSQFTGLLDKLLQKNEFREDARHVLDEGAAEWMSLVEARISEENSRYEGRPLPIGAGNVAYQARLRKLHALKVLISELAGSGSFRLDKSMIDQIEVAKKEIDSAYRGIALKANDFLSLSDKLYSRERRNHMLFEVAVPHLVTLFAIMLPAWKFGDYISALALKIGTPVYFWLKLTFLFPTLP